MAQKMWTTIDKKFLFLIKEKIIGFLIKKKLEKKFSLLEYLGQISLANASVYYMAHICQALHAFGPHLAQMFDFEAKYSGQGVGPDVARMLF